MRFAERSLIALGTLALSVWIGHEAGTRILRAHLERQLDEIRGVATSREVRETPWGPIESRTRGALVGRIDIPRVGVSSVILEGVDARTLDLAVGHIPGTARPGGGNAALAGHRDSFFRGLQDIRFGDSVELQTLSENLEYRVIWTKVTGPDDVDVIAPSDRDMITLVTCYPFHYVGPAPHRFVVRAIRVEPTSQAEAPATT